MQPWKHLSSRDIIRDRWVGLRADRCEIAPGHVIDPYYVLEQPAYVHVFALDDQDRVLLVRQYRYPAGVIGYELPGGHADPKEDLQAAAQRELLEETGCVGENWRHVAAPWANSARQDNRVHVFVADHVKVVAPQQLDRTEAITFEFMPVSAVLDVIRRGEISQSMHIALIYLTLEHLNRIALQPSPGDRATNG
jgi:8-oxo-dGTP pyrophosphatase MutT (NUDIX family)